MPSASITRLAHFSVPVLFTLDLYFCRTQDIADVASYLGVKNTELVNFTMNPPPIGSNTDRVRFYRRFYNAIILFLLIQEQVLQHFCSAIFTSVDVLCSL
jgi:hypothetical protein